MLRCHKNIHSARATQKPSWPWDRTVVGVITNSDDRVPGVLSALGLRVGTRKVGNSEQRSTESSVQDDISFVVLSYDVGYEKPDHRIFNAAKKLFEETLAERSMKAEEQFVDDFELLHIGDDVEKDYFGAKNVGWNALVLDRSGRFKQSGLGRGGVTLVNEGSDDGTSEQRKVEVITDLRALSTWTPETRKSSA